MNIVYFTGVYRDIVSAITTSEANGTPIDRIELTVAEMTDLVKSARNRFEDSDDLYNEAPTTRTWRLRKAGPQHPDATEPCPSYMWIRNVKLVTIPVVV